jgi:hypothetical protein
VSGGGTIVVRRLVATARSGCLEPFMASTHRVVLEDGGPMTAVELREADRAQLSDVLSAVGVPTGRPVLVVVGGAGGMEVADLRRLRPLFDGVVALLEGLGGVAVDGGTDAGVMRLLGAARGDAGATFPLLGVAARGTVAVGDGPHGPHAAEASSGHSLLVLVPGEDWGEESPWIAEVATALAGGCGSATLLVNGGDIAYADAWHSQREGRPVVAVAGSGRTADELSAAVAGDPSVDSRASALVGDGLVTSVSMDAPSDIVAVLQRLLGPGD